jgi:hypothetical protein
MHSTAYCLNTLFAQLGLDDSDAAIAQFIRQHAPIPISYRLWEAPCWNTGQAALLREELANDADWAEVIDQLNVLLRKTP